MSTDFAVTTSSSGGPTPLDSAHQSPADSSLVHAGVMSSPSSAKPAPRSSIKAPKDSKIRKACLSAIALRAQGMKWREISVMLGFAEDTILTYMKRAVKRGWINISAFDDPSDQIEYVLRLQAAKNLHTVLHETDASREDGSGPSNRAFEASLEIAKGTGLLKQHQVVKTDTQTNVGVALKVEVELPPSVAQASTIVVRPGTVMGTPSIDAEIVKGE